MQSFIQRHASHVIGVLSGFDRVRLRGTLRWLANTEGLRSYLFAAQILLKDFTDYAKQATDRIRQATVQIADEAGRPLIYLPSSSERKEQRAREIAERDGIQEGLICVLTSVEPCWSCKVNRDRASKKLVLRGGPNKCLHQYFYFQHPLLGFMHLRLQTWFPFTVHVCLNGREWLSRQLDQRGIAYARRGNCLVDVADVAGAQKLLNAQLCVSWEGLMNRLVRQMHPTHRHLFREHPQDYYWSIDESEWATDVMFRTPQALADLYPRLIRHGMQTLQSADVMRFLGQRLPLHGGVHGHFTGEVVSDLKTRPEGMRIKHRLNDNSLKMYDKQGTVLRVETTINNPRDMKVYRTKEGASSSAKPSGSRGAKKTSQSPPRKSWRRLRKGVADVHRRAQISQAANERYLASMATVENTQALQDVAGPLCQRVQWQQRSARGLNPFTQDDAALLEGVSRGEFLINGFRNRDLRPWLFGNADASPSEIRRQAAAVTRKLRLLRAHGLIQKVPKTHRYLLTERGRTAITALLTARQAHTAKLAELAA